MEAKFVASFETTIQSLWLRNFVSCLQIIGNTERPLRIYCDISDVVFFSKNDKYSKGVDLKYVAVKENVQNQKVPVERIDTNLTLNKGLPPKTFCGHIERMGTI